MPAFIPARSLPRCRQPLFLAQALFFFVYCVVYLAWTLFYFVVGGVDCAGACYACHTVAVGASRDLHSQRMQ